MSFDAAELLASLFQAAAPEQAPQQAASRPAPEAGLDIARPPPAGRR
jgi:hypothetical protein